MCRDDDLSEFQAAIGANNDGLSAAGVGIADSAYAADHAQFSVANKRAKNAIGLGFIGGIIASDVDLNFVVYEAHGPRAEMRLRMGEAGGGAQVKFPAVPRTCQFVALQRAGAEWTAAMRAMVIDGDPLVFEAKQRNAFPLELA